MYIHIPTVSEGFEVLNSALPDGLPHKMMNFKEQLYVVFCPMHNEQRVLEHVR